MRSGKPIARIVCNNSTFPKIKTRRSPGYGDRRGVDIREGDPSLFAAAAKEADARQGHQAQACGLRNDDVHRSSDTARRVGRVLRKAVAVLEPQTRRSDVI